MSDSEASDATDDGNREVDLGGDDGSDVSWLSYFSSSENSADSGPDSDSSDAIDQPGPSKGRKRQRTRRSRSRREENVQRGRGLTADDNTTINYQWDSYELEDPFESDWLPSFNETPGPQTQHNLEGFREVDFFLLFFPMTALELMVQETNRYAAEHLDKYYKKRWKPVTVAELKAFMGLQIGMGLFTRPAIVDHWSTFWLEETKYKSVMTRHRYQLIHKCLHFMNNAAWITRGQEGYDPLAKIQPLLDLTAPTYKAYYPSKQLSIDESMARFKGRIHIRQYMPDKPTKRGIKIFSLCDAKTRFMLKFIVYSGKEHFRVEGDNFASYIVKSLMEDFLGKGHILYTDNFYTYPSLVKWLQERNTGAVGTILDTRRGFPTSHKKSQLTLKKGDDPKFSRSDEMVCVTWHDTKRCSLLSTVHTDNTVDKRVRKRGAPGGFRTVEKPVIAEDYNSYMGGVDHFDQVAGNYAYPHRNYKWYHTIFHFVKEVALCNGFTMYSTQHPNSTAKQFRIAVIDQLCMPQVQAQQNASREQRQNPIEDRLAAAQYGHFPRKFENAKHRPRCKVCNESKIRAQTSYYCGRCNVPLCIVKCFELYHTKENYVAARLE